MNRLLVSGFHNDIVNLLLCAERDVSKTQTTSLSLNWKYLHVTIETSFS